MSDEVIKQEPEGGEGAPEAPAKPKGKKKLFILAGAGAALLLVGGGGGYMIFGGKASGHDAAHGAAEATAAAPEEKSEAKGKEGKDANLPFDVPPILVNLRSPDGAPHFLKVHVMLVPGPKSGLEELKKELPLLLDAYQPFLRELRPEDLSGSAAVYRIKEELLLRARDTIGADKVKEVLVQDLVQQ